MALLAKGGVPLREVQQLREEGMSDNQVIDELRAGGYSLPQINDALAQAALMGPGGGENIPLEESSYEGGYEESAESVPARERAANLGEDLHGRIEEIAENIIDEKWDLLIEEVKKIVEWKERVEEKVGKLEGDISKLEGDFKELHQGVLGRLESYDEKVTEVGTELKAVGKVFKDVVPEFVENVKELKAITKGVKGKK